MTETCPICNGSLEPGQTECARCGFKLIGKTQAFKMVADQSEGTVEVTQPKGTPALEVLTGPYAKEQFVMDFGTFTLGRDPNCDVFLSNSTVSRHHATIEIGHDKASITDNGSLNGTWVDGKVVETAPLYTGTHVQIGTFDMAFKYV